MRSLQSLDHAHHVLRYVKWTHLQKDEEGNVIGVLSETLKYKKSEDCLSVCWVEYHFDDKEPVKACIREFSNNYEVTKKARFALANVGRLKESFKSRQKSIRVVYEPNEILCHSAMRQVPQDDFALLAAVAEDAFDGLFPTEGV